MSIESVLKSDGCATITGLSISTEKWSVDKVHKVVELQPAWLSNYVTSAAADYVWLEGTVEGKIDGSANVCDTTFDLSGGVSLYLRSNDKADPAYIYYDLSVLWTNIKIEVNLNSQRIKASFVNHGMWNEYNE